MIHLVNKAQVHNRFECVECGRVTVDYTDGVTVYYTNVLVTVDYTNRVTVYYTNVLADYLLHEWRDSLLHTCAR